MTIPLPKIELFTEAIIPGVDYFTLNDPVLGLLDGEGELVGKTWVDISPRAVNYSISRGRSSIFGYNPAGRAQVSLNNQDRLFDPTNSDSYLVSAVFPKIPVRITINNEIQFIGKIDDWDLSFIPGRDIMASFSASDAFTDWAGNTLDEYTPQSFNATSEAISEALAKIGVTTGGPSEPEGIVMGTALVATGTNALQYVQKLSTSDFGSLYIDKSGSWNYSTFARRITGVIAQRIAPDTDKPIHLASIMYGSENLYNRITLTNSGVTASVVSETSIEAYGERDLVDSSSLVSGSLGGAFLGVIATEVLEIYSEPELRISSIELLLHSMNETNQNEILNLELADRVIISFDPDGSGKKIVRINKIIAIEHSVKPGEHILRLGFESSSSTPLVIGDPDLGRLNAGNFLERTYDFGI